jgi:hypothetical protein
MIVVPGMVFGPSRRLVMFPLLGVGSIVDAAITMFIAVFHRLSKGRIH